MPNFDSHQNFGGKNRRRFKMATVFLAMVNPTPSKNMTKKWLSFGKWTISQKLLTLEKRFWYQIKAEILLILKL